MHSSQFIPSECSLVGIPGKYKYKVMLFAVVDHAIASGNNDQLALTLNSITEIAKSCTFKDLANLASVRAALDDPDHKWTF